MHANARHFLANSVSDCLTKVKGETCINPPHNFSLFKSWSRVSFIPYSGRASGISCVSCGLCLPLNWRCGAGRISKNERFMFFINVQRSIFFLPVASQPVRARYNQPSGCPISYWGNQSVRLLTFI